MKAILIISLLLSVPVLAGDGILPGKSLPKSAHILVKTYPQDDLDEGTCKIIGKVYQDYDKNSPLSRVLVSTLDKEYFTYTDTNGNYEIIIDASDTSLFAFKSQYAEHVIWNIKFQERYVYEIDFTLSVDQSMLIVDKPVIYLYNDEDLSVNIKFNPIGDLTFTYPAYNEQYGWSVALRDNKIVSGDRQYPYLFWESETNDLEFDESSGSVYGAFIATDSAVDYLENSLSALGLNHTEQTDFITYWMPKMQQHPYAFIQFIIDEDYERNISQMSIDPMPDKIRRVFMLYKSFDQQPTKGNYASQDLPGFEREGFTMVEWGGAETNNCKAFIYEMVEK